MKTNFWKKKSSVGITIMFLVLGLSFGTVKIWAKLVLPRVINGCESKYGIILTKDNGDGFNKMKSCPKGTREVILGEESKSNIINNEMTIGAGNVAFVSNDYNNDGFLLLKNGETWKFTSDGGIEAMIEFWSKDETRNLPEGVKVTDIVQWNDILFLTKEGTVYKYSINASKWIKTGNPVDNPNWTN